MCEDIITFDRINGFTLVFVRDRINRTGVFQIRDPGGHMLAEAGPEEQTGAWNALHLVAKKYGWERIRINGACTLWKFTKGAIVTYVVISCGKVIYEGDCETKAVAIYAAECQGQKAEEDGGLHPR